MEQENDSLDVESRRNYEALSLKQQCDALYWIEKHKLEKEDAIEEISE